MDIQQKISDVKWAILNKQKVKEKDTGYEYIPTALRLSHNIRVGWLYSVECVDEKTNSVIHIKLADIEFL